MLRFNVHSGGSCVASATRRKGGPWGGPARAAPQPLASSRTRSTQLCSASASIASSSGFGASGFAGWRRLRREPALSTLTCRSGAALERSGASLESLPADLQVEVKEEDGTTNVEYDEESKVVRIPLSALGEGAQRRTKLVLFTCNKCGGRTARMVNPIAWENGVVFGQCGKCEVWHVLSAKNKSIYEEINYKTDPEWADPPAAAQAAADKGPDGEQPQ